MKKLLLLAVLLASLSFPVFAAKNPGYFKLSLWDNLSVALPNNTQDITGVDLGIGSHSFSVTGLQADLMWAESKYITGASLSMGISKTRQTKGVQWAFVTMSEDVTGVQLGFVNMTAYITGVQFGGANMSSREIVGMQAGFYNQAKYVNGLQFGLVNYAQYIYGLQLGLINIADNGYLPAMIFVNGRF